MIELKSQKEPLINYEKVQTVSLNVSDTANTEPTAALLSPVAELSLPIIHQIDPVDQEMGPEEPSTSAWDPNFCNIEEEIDELERRVKQEEARYASLSTNRHHYEQYMDPVQFESLLRTAACRLVNFDPNFDAPNYEPWE